MEYPSYPFDLLKLPELQSKPRSKGITAVIDKGLGPAAAADLVATAAPWIDVVKLGWGTSRLYPTETLKRKLETYRGADVLPCTGGTLLEVAYAQGRHEELFEAARGLGFSLVEVSNGVHPMSQDEKIALITRARDLGFDVWSEVGKKDPEEDRRLGLDDRFEAIRAELEAGSSRVILEGRESGTVGIYDRTGQPAVELLERAVEEFGTERLVIEAPRKAQQLWMIQKFGLDVNLGNVPPEDAIALATLRFGLRGDTFADVHLSGVQVFMELGVHGAIQARERGGVVVLIDALRASATIVTALARGMRAVRPVGTPEECVGEITAGERGGRKLPHVKHANSPTEFEAHDYPDKTLILTSTNGIECLLTAAGEQTRVLVGTTLNRSAVARAAFSLAQEHGFPITLLMAGRNNQRAIEDALAAGEILAAIPGSVRVHGEPAPLSDALEAAFFESESGRNLVELGYSADVRRCAQLDVYDVVPVLNDGELRALAFAQ